MAIEFKQCRDCEFYVWSQDDYCPNCGIIAPQYHLSTNALSEELKGYTVHQILKL